MSESIRILIADDHEVVRDGLRMILEAEKGFSVVGEAGDGAQAVYLTEKLQPQVILMDLRMPRMDGIEVFKKLNRKDTKEGTYKSECYQDQGKRHIIYGRYHGCAQSHSSDD